MAWLISVLVFAPICAAAMAAAWVLGSRNRVSLLIWSMTAGVVSGVLAGWLASAAFAPDFTGWAVARGGAFGAAVGTGVWVLLLRLLGNGKGR